MTPPLIVCMGVSGAGKSTSAQILAAKFELTLIEADDLHSLSNKQKMQAGAALTDADRAPWMQAVCRQLSTCAERGIGCVLAHSALRRAHREQLRSCGLRTLFLHLDAPRETIARRLREREHHYMNAELLDSQFEALQPTDGEADVVTLTALDREALMAQASARVVDFIAQGTITGDTGHAVTTHH
ncbi:gluconokinase [Exilibacterium tricleocarpae]|uniref:Gluconokinase n=1 Tax=Exilibacterium tricleocarpae TaxID=2591008 RepID=A0A545TLS9_9GAMM|nr:gluconokinase [Exilibacterium tricleocarpae]TQV78183.1 gluconokinase [Exilibacterium tricleocarpae]